MSDKNCREAAEFEELLAPHIQRMFRLAYRFTGNMADSEDLVQDVLVKIYPRKNEVVRIEKLGPWEMHELLKRRA